VSEPGSSVSSVWLRAGRLGDRGSIPGRGERIFPLASVAHPASCSVGAGCPFPEATARPERDSDHTPPSSTEVENE
jgi:hypothetical protein